jgi:hypothetical protein
MKIQIRIATGKLELLFGLLKEALENNEAEDMDYIAEECLMQLRETARLLGESMKYVKQRFSGQEHPLDADIEDIFYPLVFWSVTDAGSSSLYTLRMAHDVAKFAKRKAATYHED